MLRCRSAALLNLFAALLLAGALPLARGAELADPVVRSFAGQPLVADIELTALSDLGQAVVVRLAHPDVFKGANIRMHPALASVTLSVMRRDGRQFLHITSTRPVESEYLLMFLELADGSRRDVRLATLWLAPDPSPPVPVKPVVPIALAPPAVASAPAPAPAPALAPAPAPAPAPMPAVTAARLAMARPAPPAACPRPEVAPAAATCSPLEYRNGLLSAQIVELEEKVRALERAMNEKGMTVAPAAPPPAPAVTAAPRPAAKERVEAPFPWLLVAGATLAVIALAAGGVGFVLFRRRKVAGEPPPVPEPEADSLKTPWYKRLGNRFRRTPASAPDEAAEAVAEP